MTNPPAGQDHVQLQLGLYVLGALSSSERAVVEEHLANCAPCRTECAELSEIPALLSLLTREDVRSIADQFPPRLLDADRPASRPPNQDTDPRPPIRPAPAGNRGQPAKALRPRRARQGLLVVLATLALALVVGVGIGLRLASSPAAITLAGSDTNAVTGVTMSITVVGLADASRVTATAKGLNPGVLYQLYAVDSRGQTLIVASWTAQDEPYTYAGDLRVPAGDLAFFTLTDLNGQVVITVKVAKSS